MTNVIKFEKADIRNEDINLLEQMRTTAAELVMALDKELSGLRDGNGRWLGANPIDHYAGIIADLQSRRGEIQT